MRNKPACMLRNYFLTALRSFRRQRSYSLINLSGLAVGLTCSIFILLWVTDEVSYNTINTDRDRIFQVLENQTYSGNKIYTFSATPGLLAEALKAEIPEVEYSCRTSWGDRMLFQVGDKSIYEEGLYADPSIFQILTLPILDGDALNPLPDNNSVAISQKMARKYFGEESPIGKMFRVNNTFDAKVTAVFKDIPQNSSITAEFLLNFDRTFRAKPWMSEWGSNGIQTFVKLDRAEAKEAVNGKIKDFIKKRERESVVDLFLFPMTEWRLYSHFEEGKQQGGRITYVRAFAVVAVFILVIACINFMNLATARAANRSREVGLRKVVGAQRQSIIAQFIGESMLMAFLSFAIALLAVHLLMPTFNELTGKQVFLDYADPLVILTLVGILLLTGLLSGSYPAFFLSAFQPAAVLKGNTGGVFSGSRLRKILVVFQFSLSVTLIVCALVVYQQIEFIRNKNLGFDRENILYFSRYHGIEKSYESFRSELLQHPAIRSVAVASQLPMNIGESSGAQWEGKSEDDRALFPLIQCDYDYIPLAGMQLVAGRNFSRDIASDTINYIVMEETAKRMGMKDPVGQRLEVWGRKGQIIGVIKDFHSQGLRWSMEPVILMCMPARGENVFVQYEPGQGGDVAKIIEPIHKKFESVFPFEPNYLDQAIDREYKSEIMIGKLSAVFTGMTIFISCLGLFGLASYTTERRTKEIGIRKALGASVSTVVMMLCRDFVRLVVFALVIGSPLAWYVMQKFLEQYKFHTDLTVKVFLVTALMIVILALLTVSYRSVQAALSNPVKALRSE